VGTRTLQERQRSIDTSYFSFKGGPTMAAKKVALNGTAIHAASGFAAWQNPEAGSIIITDVILHLTTVATGACTLDIGTTATSAATTSDNLIDGLDVNAALGVFTNGSDAGTNGKSRQLLAAGKWITVDEKTGDSTGLIAELTIFYLIP
jgi:hypothetical protein